MKGLIEMKEEKKEIKEKDFQPLNVESMKIISKYFFMDK